MYLCMSMNTFITNINGKTNGDRFVKPIINQSS